MLPYLTPLHQKPKIPLTLRRLPVTSYAAPRRFPRPRLIEETIDRWDGDELSRKLELEVGRDLQFVRINGTLVGGLLGLVLHALTSLL